MLTYEFIVLLQGMYQNRCEFLEMTHALLDPLWVGHDTRFREAILMKKLHEAKEATASAKGRSWIKNFKTKFNLKQNQLQASWYTSRYKCAHVAKTEAAAILGNAPLLHYILHLDDHFTILRQKGKIRLDSLLLTATDLEHMKWQGCVKMSKCRRHLWPELCLPFDKVDRPAATDTILDFP